MSRTTYNPAVLIQAAEDVRRCHNALVSDKEGMEQFLRSLRAEWYGSSSSNWQGVQNEWNTACDDINLILMNLRMALDGAANHAVVVERGLEQMWSV
jgi:WXG100 family type VII secretion target